MDIKRKKELLQEWKNRHPEMGVISFRCKETGESFLEISNDTKADINSSRFQLSMGGHPNKILQGIWNEHGEESFELSVLRVLKYKDPSDDHTKELKKLIEECFEEDKKARKLKNNGKK